MQPRAPFFLAGATSAGKSAVALSLAARLGGEIISVDSMQVYRGLNLGTAKPSREDQRRAPHHLVDVIDLDESFDAARFVKMAIAAVSDIQSRGLVPIFCGGTGLYFKAYLEGLGAAPPASPAIRGQLQSIPLPELLAELERNDPVTFLAIDRQNPRRVIRALEVIRLTGRPFSEQRSRWSVNALDSRWAGARFIGLTRPAGELTERIHQRIDEMFRQGLVAETESLLERGLAANPTALQALGYRQVVEHLRGERGLDATIELVKTRTRQFAKRQLTWFRRQMNLEWITLSDPAFESIVEKLAAGI